MKGGSFSEKGGFLSVNVGCFSVSTRATVELLLESSAYRATVELL